MDKAIIKELINKQDPFVLDIGCYNGKDSKELSDVLDCEVHCFEADPASQQLFMDLHGDNEKLILYPFALTDVDGMIDLYQSNHPQSNSTREPKKHLELFPSVEFDKRIIVKTHRLDSWYRGHGDIIDFIWADVNGSEMDLIIGGPRALSNTRYLYIEVSINELYKGQAHYNSIMKMLREFELISEHNFGENFGNVLLKNRYL